MSDDPTDAKPPTGFDAVKVAADGDPSPAAAFNALAYFMGDEAPPGADEMVTMDMDFGRKDKRPVRVVCRSLALEELDRCSALAREALENQPKMGDLGLGFVRWSYVFAYACQQPNLGEALTARRVELQRKAQDASDPVAAAEAEAELKLLSDTASLVRIVFRKRPGVLQHAVFAVEAKAKLGQDGVESISVVEVEAGKA